MEMIDVFAALMSAAVLTLGWTEWRKMRREDELHAVRVMEAELTCRKLALEIERATVGTPPNAA